MRIYALLFLNIYIYIYIYIYKGTNWNTWNICSKVFVLYRLTGFIFRGFLLIAYVLKYAKKCRFLQWN